ncbi:MAG: sigma 54-interacting transcriptional regulator, partial [Nitrospiria bacterium]
MTLGKIVIFEKEITSNPWREISKSLRVEEKIFTCLKSAIHYVNQTNPSIFLISQPDNRKLPWKFINPLIKSHLNNYSKNYIVSSNPISDSIFPVIAPTPSEIIQTLENIIHENFIFESIKKYHGLPVGGGKIMLGESSAMIKLFKMILRRSNGNENCLIYGESGVGKTLTTDALHCYHRSHSQYSMETVNVTEISDNIFEAEFFGAKKGAYTGCDKDKLGFFDKTKGTLFIDEIGNLPLLSQSKLLRALGEKKYKPMGSQESKEINARLIFATNKNLKQMVLENKFMEDLLYRIEKVSIHLPSLQERKEDIPLLVDDYVKSLNLRYGKSKNVPDNVHRYLMLYAWPGNIRELHGKLDIAFEDSGADDVSVDHFPDLKIDPKLLLQKEQSKENPFVHYISLYSSEKHPGQKQTCLIARLKGKMKERAISQKELAKGLGIAKSTISMWFHKNSLRGISGDLIKKIEEWLETGQIITRNERKTENRVSEDKIKMMMDANKISHRGLADA